MSLRKRCLMIGAGGMAATWIRHILPPFADRLEIIGLVDVSESALAASGDFLGLDRARRFTRLDHAFDNVDADFCAVVIPAAFHAAAALLAAKRGLPILCEKPLADTWAGCLDIFKAVTHTRTKMQMVQNYRYRPSMLAMKALLDSGKLGRINYVVSRFADDYREFDTWQRRHELPHAMLMDGAAHHFDMLRHLTGSDCVHMATQEWNPAWSSSTGEFNALCLMRMANGTPATYEGNATAAGTQNPWRQEYYRAECEDGAVDVGFDQIVRCYRHARGRGLIVEEIPAPVPAHEAHGWIVAEFLDWLDGGPTPATSLDDNVRTAAMIFGAIEAARTDQAVNIKHMLDEAV